MTDGQKEVLRKIIYAAETGGNVYGQQDYGNFTEAYANSNDERAITIGAGQWYADEARELLCCINAADRKLWRNLDTAGVLQDITLYRSWNSYNISAGSAIAKCIKSLIATSVGIRCQDEMMDKQMEQYCKESEALGVADPAAQAMCANFRHQGGASAVLRILTKAEKPYTLDTLYAACRTDSGNQVGAYRSRQKFVYNSLKKHFPKEGERMTKTEKAVAQMEKWANDAAHGYDQVYRWGEKGDYDCSSAVISAWELAGIPVKSSGATYTGDMRKVFLSCGFRDVTESVNLSTGEGLRRGDVLLNEVHHVAMYCGDGKEVEASINEKGTATGGDPGDQTGKEFLIRSYRNYPWNCVLRYPEQAADTSKKQENDGRNSVLYPARMRKDTAAYTWAGTDSARSKMYPTIRKDALVDIMDYTQKDSGGKNWYFARLPHPTEGFVSVFVPAGSFRHFK